MFGVNALLMTPTGNHQSGNKESAWIKVSWPLLKNNPTNLSGCVREIAEKGQF
jgi:hypothetical protein